MGTNDHLIKILFFLKGMKHSKEPPLFYLLMVYFSGTFSQPSLLKANMPPIFPQPTLINA